jgi:16S rRNA (guanine527-N7)-methyltransferase
MPAGRAGAEGRDSVSRETTPLSLGGEAPTPPALAEATFGDALPLARRYADHLAHAGVVRGLIGPREVDRLWERHLLNSAVLAQWVPDGSTVADLGSGAGLPGIPLALARPDLSVTLVEPLLRRTTFLNEVVADLDLAGRVDVIRGKAEVLHGHRTFDVVTARALAPLDRLLGWAMPLVRPGGALIALKGETAGAELAAAQSQLSRLGAQSAEVLVSSGETVVRVVRVVKSPTASAVSSSKQAAVRPNGSRGRRKAGPGSSPGGRGRP